MVDGWKIENWAEGKSYPRPLGKALPALSRALGRVSILTIERRWWRETHDSGKT